MLTLKEKFNNRVKSILYHAGVDFREFDSLCNYITYRYCDLPFYFYHDRAHIDAMLDRLDLFFKDKLSSHEYLLCQVSIIFHDIVYSFEKDMHPNNEENSIKFFNDVKFYDMKNYNQSRNTIIEAIRTTKVSNIKNKFDLSKKLQNVAKIVADLDIMCAYLCNSELIDTNYVEFGKEDFNKHMLNVCKEMGIVHGRTIELEEQKDFLIDLYKSSDMLFYHDFIFERIDQIIKSRLF